MIIKIIGVDLAKNVFELCGLDANGEIQLRRRVQRETLLRALEENRAIVAVADKNVCIIWAAAS